MTGRNWACCLLECWYANFSLSKYAEAGRMGLRQEVVRLLPVGISRVMLELRCRPKISIFGTSVTQCQLFRSAVIDATTGCWMLGQLWQLQQVLLS